MNATARQAAHRFLLETYGFDPATRTAIIDRAVVEIRRNAEALLAALVDGDEPVKCCAHRLKGNLLALGLRDLAGQSREIEALAGDPAGANLTDAVQALCRTLTESPPG